MLFIHPMWDTETQRIGKMRCSSRAYSLHVTAELIGFIGALTLVGFSLWFVGTWLVSTWETPTFWLFVIPLLLGIVSEIGFQYSWIMVNRKEYRYDAEGDLVTWKEGKSEHSYCYKQKPAEQAADGDADEVV
jgi:hypothetical protein